LRILVTKHRELLGEIEDEVRSLLCEGHSGPWWAMPSASAGKVPGQRYRHLVTDKVDLAAGHRRVHEATSGH
jgi:hypothetical protein